MRTIISIRIFLLVGGIFLASQSWSQELYVFSEPASNMPAHSISAKLAGKFVKDQSSDRFLQRYTPEVMFGISSRWMVHGAVTVSDMFSPDLRPESGRVYAKYRFYSDDQVHKHFRMAAYGEAGLSRNKPVFEELSIEGDQSGIGAGLIATQLLGKLALSAVGGYTMLTLPRPKMNAGDYVYQGYQYSVSAGYLLLPAEYRDFRQTNLNLYAELIGQRSTDKSRYFVDFAPAVQLIFNSNTKLNLGYRFQLGGNMTRMAERGFLISIERTFLGAL